MNCNLATATNFYYLRLRKFLSTYIPNTFRKTCFASLTHKSVSYTQITIQEVA